MCKYLDEVELRASIHRAIDRSRKERRAITLKFAIGNREEAIQIVNKLATSAVYHNGNYTAYGKPRGNLVEYWLRIIV